MRALFVTSILVIFALAGAARAETAAPAGKNAQARELKAAQAKCAAKTGAEKDRCLADAQTAYGRTSVGKGQYGYVPAGGGGASVGNAKTLPKATAKAQQTSKDLSSAKLPSNQPTDVARAAAQVKQDAGK